MGVSTSIQCKSDDSQLNLSEIFGRGFFANVIMMYAILPGKIIPRSSPSEATGENHDISWFTYYQLHNVLILSADGSVTDCPCGCLR